MGYVKAMDFSFFVHMGHKQTREIVFLFTVALRFDLPFRLVLIGDGKLSGRL